MRTLTQAHLWLSPLHDEPGRKWINYGWRWRGGNEKFTTLEINHRPLATMGVETRRWRSLLLRCASTPQSA
ncbi:hypothetical protein [Shigella dysenteriae]|uniref:hypothetical protein n=1 Tax=Shigella dysenteriae TaxID=622 RepID=UPI0032C4A35B